MLGAGWMVVKQVEYSLVLDLSELSVAQAFT